MGKRNDILSKYKAELEAVSGMTPERVKIGRIVPARRGQDEIMIVPDSETVLEIEADETKRQLSVAIIAIIRLDPSHADAQWTQLNDRWEQIEPTVEDLQLNRVGGLVHNVEVAPPGVDWDAYDDGDSFAVVGVVHEIEYERAAGT